MLNRVRNGKFIFLIALLGATGCQTIAGRIFLPRDGVRPAEYSVTAERGVATIMADGTPLVSKVYRPKNLEKSPTLLVRIPMSDSFRNRLMANLLGEFCASRGYAVVVQQTRGRWPSGGTFYPMRPDRADGIDTLKWISQQSWYDGRIGMWGGSSFGYTQWCIADQTDPGPSAYMIQIASSHIYDLFYQGNAFALETALYWAYRGHRDWDKTPPTRILDQGVNGFPLVEADDRASEDIPFFNDWTRHVTRDAYWTEIDRQDQLRKLRAPVHLIAGWYDPFLPAQLDDFIQIRRDGDQRAAKGTRLVIGPWSHAATVTFPDGFKDTLYRTAILEPMIDWFDTHLTGVSDVALAMPPVKLFVMGANQWRDEQEWPLARARETAYYLRSDGHANTATGGGHLSLEPARSAEPPDAYTYDPINPVPIAGGAVLGPRAGVVIQNDIEQRHDVLVYTTPTLTQDTEVTGPIRLILFVATSASNTDFTAKLVDVHPNGDAYNVCDGIRRRSYTQSKGTTKIAIELWPTSMLFFKDHSIRLEVSSSSFPRFDRNPNTGRFIPTETKPVSALQQVHHGPATPSRLLLPLIPAE